MPGHTVGGILGSPDDEVGTQRRSTSQGVWCGRQGLRETVLEESSQGLPAREAIKTRGGVGGTASSDLGQGVTGTRQGVHAGGQRAESGRSGRAVAGVCRRVVGAPREVPGMQPMGVPGLEGGWILGWKTGREQGGTTLVLGTWGPGSLLTHC